MEKNLIFKVCILILLLNISLFAKIKRPSKEHIVYFKGTNYQLDVYKIYGRYNGKTMLIIGGIQGDEPGGYLSADLYADFNLFKGNLIVIPRANLKSIILFTRGVDGDMNRQFNKKNYKTPMGKAVKLLKKYMGEADVFLHLHDGWGYHYPVYVNKNRNPKRFGESIIIDNDTYKCKNGKILELKKIAETVLKNVNKKISNKKFYLHLFNTRTFDKDTPFKDMRKAATFFALTHYCVPSYAIETSKNLPSLEMKIRIHNYAINEFMKIYGIIPEVPPVITVKPILKSIVINVNNIPTILKDREILYLKKGSNIEITEIDSNYKRGLSVDILGYGSLNDFKKKIKIYSDTKIIVRKDNKKFGEIYIKTVKPFISKQLIFIVKVNNNIHIYQPGENFKVKKGDILEIVGVTTLNKIIKDIKVNLKGYVPKGIVKNIGDDRGYRIKIDSKFMKKYSRFGKGEIYPIVATKNNKELGKIWLQIER